FANGHLRDYIRVSAEMRYGLMHRGDPGYRAADEVERNTAYRALYAFAPQRIYPEAQYGQGEFYRRTRTSGAPISFVEEFGGNVDSRFLIASGRFLKTEDGHSFIGTATGAAEMRVGIPANRLRGELI